ncbi:MAG: hypothetical protein QHJ73_14970, partial [Armatimonadota bacterium]|nr:hypothetical protein [Armatimonadota bacterium]
MPAGMFRCESGGNARATSDGEARRLLPEGYYPAAAVLGAAVFSFYVYTLAPSWMPGDSPDLVVAAATFREAHPT